VPESAKCSADADCGEGFCCQGSTFQTVTTDCGGICVVSSPQACPSMWSWDGVKANLQDSKKYVDKAVECMAKANVPDISKDLVEYGCSLAGSDAAGMLLKVACDHIAPSDALRLLPDDSSPAHELEPRRLQSIGIGNASKPETLVLGCEERSSCKGGAEIDYFAEVDFEPAFNFEADMRKLQVTVSAGGTVRGSAGFAVTAGGGCAESKTLAYPEVPKPVATFCLAAMCITVAMQMRLDLEMQGTLALQASAEYHTVYEVSGDATLSLDIDAIADQASGVHFNVARTSEFWKVKAAGAVDATISAKLGPVLTVLVVPGAFVSIFPFVIGELSLYGEFDYEKQGGEMTAEIP